MIMIKEFLEGRRKQRYLDGVAEINQEIFQNHQRKLLAIKVASEFSDVDELEMMIEQGQEAIDYFMALQNENVKRLEELKKGKMISKNKVVDF